jgi:hypothetical protein
MSDNTTIAEIYEALNPLPALLSAKGKVNPEVDFRLEANADFSVSMSWKKDDARHEYDRDYEYYRAETFAQAVGCARAFIAALPSAEQAKLHAFMGQLGRLIDSGNAVGIDVEYVNPLVETMKRLSEAAITYRSIKEPA